MAYSSNWAGFFLSSLLLFCSIVTIPSSATDTISSGQQLTSSQTLISKGGKFELGFFRPGNSPNYYVGIWYKKVSVKNKTYVWVANRDTPVTQPSTSKLRFSEDGNLVLFDDQANIEVWSTSLKLNTMDSFQEAVLGDDGNFVLRNGARPSDVYWQSFDYPSDTWLPDARVRYDNNHNITKQPVLLTSWKNANDPSKGLYSVERDPIGEGYVLKWNGTQTYWRSGRWNGKTYSGLPEMRFKDIYSINYTENEKESYFTYHVIDTSITCRFVMDLSGQIGMSTWDPVRRNWYLFWSHPRQPCQVNSTYCGPYGVCNQMNSPFCQCIEGFIPHSPKDWYASDYSGGCVRKTCGTQDRFSVISNVILPQNEISLVVANVDECKSACLNNCSCSAYAYSSGCSIWIGDLSDLQQLSDDDGGGNNLYLRLVASDIQNNGVGSSSESNQKGNILKVILPVVSTVLVLGLITTFMVLKKKQHRKAKVILKNKSHKEDLELPLFDLVTIATATNQFSLSNKIGQGGFGPVYKAVLPNGEEIAIKRLSKDSRQGLQEFMNEVFFIAKLQHRNLVKLLGCCIQGEERMLIYEYMPNKSLDFFIFDKTRSIDLHWEKRFNIIAGIARGLLYLHRDSRLRIVHRDLKASNVLLDNEMNPKISDFGMARTFRGDQTEDKIRRVVGTYGYMSPEYATDGLFSTKSDVFSFGVLVLEIISGKKNRLFHHVDHDLNLIGHTWKLLNDNKALEIMDTSIKDSFTAFEVLKCIQVGLLCVQKFPVDRPAMPSVLSMLDSDGVMLPWPKQPGFYTERAPCEIDSSSTQVTHNSRNEVTVTLFEGR